MYKTKFSDIRRIFFPNNFYEKYKYLGNVPYDEKSDMFRAIYPLVIEMDKRAKPYWCPRWLLRFLFFRLNSVRFICVRAGGLRWVSIF